MRYTFLFFLMLLSLNLFAQSKRAEKNLKAALELALSKKTQHNLVDSKRLILEDSLVAVDIAEAILFPIYGKEQIENEKPYNTFLIDNYWVISGKLPDGYVGGTFLIILDARNSEVIKITHGK